MLVTEERLYEAIGDRIRQAREKSEPYLSQTALAAVLEISRASVVNIEAGRQRTPIHVVWRIAECLNVEPRNLFPTSDDFLDDQTAFKLDADEIATIEEQVAGNSKAKRLISRFIAAAKIRSQEKRQ